MTIFRRVCKTGKSDSCFFVSVVRPPARMKQLGSRWTHFHEIWYWSISRKSVEKNLISVKSDNNNGYFAWRPMYTMYSLSHSVVLTQLYKNSKNTVWHTTVQCTVSNFYFETSTTKVPLFIGLYCCNATCFSRRATSMSLVSK
jgi:hypothetical protein